MVVFVDLDDPDEVEHRPFDMRDLINANTYNTAAPLQGEEQDEDADDDGGENPNLNTFSAALGCYPFVPGPSGIGRRIVLTPVAFTASSRKLHDT